MAENEQRCSIPCVRLANTRKTFEIMVQISAVLNLGQLTPAVSFSNEDGEQVIL